MIKLLYQPYHLVTLRPWPILISLNLLLLLGLILEWISLILEFKFILIILFNIIILRYQWWRDVIRERTYQGFHRIKVYKGLKLGIIIFIISEIFFFLRIFWCYLHIYLNTRIELGQNWPPLGLIIFNYLDVPLLNTILLLSSGVSVTWCHYSILNNKLNDRKIRILLTILLGLIFRIFQLYEYKEAIFTIRDSVYGSIFFIGTGFHGLHVLIGSLFLLINFIRIKNLNYRIIRHFGLEGRIWYWHFVDVVWLFLYIIFYIIVSYYISINYYI